MRFLSQCSCSGSGSSTSCGLSLLQLASMAPWLHYPVSDWWSRSACRRTFFHVMFLIYIDRNQSMNKMGIEWTKDYYIQYSGSIIMQMAAMADLISWSISTHHPVELDINLNPKVYSKITKERNPIQMLKGWCHIKLCTLHPISDGPQQRSTYAHRSQVPLPFMRIWIPDPIAIQ